MTAPMTTTDAYWITYDQLICGCGISEAGLRLVRDMLTELASASAERREGIAAGPACTKLVPGELERYLLLCMLDNAGLTGHGSSIGYSWLTEKGEQYLAALQTYTYEQISDGAIDDPTGGAGR